MPHSCFMKSLIGENIFLVVNNLYIIRIDYLCADNENQTAKVEGINGKARLRVSLFKKTFSKKS